jgi:SAM-dependent methyltransferase
VFSNSLVHHLPEHADFFQEMVRVLRPNGVVFLRDLLRPETSVQVESLVQKYGGEDSHGQQMLRQSLHAALRLEEVRNLAAAVGIPSECVQVTSDRHWTLAARANESKQSFVPISIAPEQSDPHSVALGKSDAT